LGQLFCSTARTEVLRALYYQPEGVGIRRLARIAGVHVRSAELAANELVNDKLVSRRRRGRRVFYTLRRTHPDAVTLAAVFEAAERAHIRADRADLDKRARRILPFIRQANRMIHHARWSHEA
jgi:hypothetical protein